MIQYNEYKITVHLPPNAVEKNKKMFTWVVGGIFRRPREILVFNDGIILKFRLTPRQWKRKLWWCYARFNGWHTFASLAVDLPSIKWGMNKEQHARLKEMVSKETWLD